jgi:hypothetical protein
MKNIIYFFVLFLLVSCKKQNKTIITNTDKIIIYSYESRNVGLPPPPPGISIEKYFGISTEEYFKKENIVNDGVLNKVGLKIKEEIVLNEEQILELNEFLKTDICKEEGIHAACYIPRHLIAFYDENGKIIAYNEICLSCGNERKSKNLDKFPKFL